MEEMTKKEATVYYSKDKKLIQYIHLDGIWHSNMTTDGSFTGAMLAEAPTAEELKRYGHFIFNNTAEELNTKERLVALAQRAQEELAKLPAADPVPAKSGIAAGSNSTENPAAKGYSLHYWMNRCREEINKKLGPDYSLPEKSFNLVTKDGHTLTIEDNGNIKANLAPLSSKDAKEFAAFICKDLKAIVNMYMSMYEKEGMPVFPENRINLFVIEENIKSPEEKAKLAKIKELVATEMHAFLNDPKIPNDVKNKFTVLGRTLAQGPAPASAPAPKPSAPPLSNAPKDVPKSDSAAPDELKMGPTPPPPPGSPRPK